MLTTIVVTIAGGHYMDALAPDYFETALSRMMHTVCCPGTFEDGEAGEITRRVLTANRLKPNRTVRQEFEELVDSFRLPAAKLMFRPGQVLNTSEAEEPNFHAVLQDLIEEEGGHHYTNVFDWVYATPGASDAVKQAYGEVLVSLHRQAAKFLPHLHKALTQHTYAPDYAFLTGLQAAGMVLDLEVYPWLQSYSLKHVDDNGEVIFSML
jgi:hypothetical protein